MIREVDECQLVYRGSRRVFTESARLESHRVRQKSNRGERRRRRSTAADQSNTHGFSRRKSTVRSTPCRMPNRGAQPVARAFFVSRKINGLSPTHPRSPPLNRNS